MQLALLWNPKTWSTLLSRHHHGWKTYNITWTQRFALACSSSVVILVRSWYLSLFCHSTPACSAQMTPFDRPSNKTTKFLCGYLKAMVLDAHRSSSSMGISSISLLTMESATFQIWIRLSSAALQTTHGSFIFQLKSARWFVWPPCMNKLYQFSKLITQIELRLTAQVVHPPGHLGAVLLPPCWGPRKWFFDHSCHFPELPPVLGATQAKQPGQDDLLEHVVFPWVA